MSKQDKIEKAQATKAAKGEKATSQKLAEQFGTGVVGITFDSAPVGQRYYQIAGTEYYSRVKKDLKGVRRVKNAQAGVLEVDATDADTNETVKSNGSNTWPFRITKGPDHPRLKG